MTSQFAVLKQAESLAEKVSPSGLRGEQYRAGSQGHPMPPGPEQQG